MRSAVVAGVSPAGQSPALSGLPAVAPLDEAGAELASSTRWVESAGSNTAPLPPRAGALQRRAQTLVPTPATTTLER